MKKSLLCFSLFIFGFSFCKAQDTLVFESCKNPAKKFFFSLNYGWSIPVGDFFANEMPSIYTSGIDGNANIGPHGDINCGYNFIGPLSAMLEFGQDNNYENYHIRQYLAGLSIGTNEVKHDVSIHLSWLVGLETANYPYNTSYTGNSTTTTISLNNGKGFENYLSIKLELNPIRVLGVCLNAGYMITTIKYSNSSSYTEAYSNSITATQTFSSPVTMTLSAFEINFGLSYHFL